MYVTCFFCNQEHAVMMLCLLETKKEVCDFVVKKCVQMVIIVIKPAMMSVQLVSTVFPSRTQIGVYAVTVSRSNPKKHVYCIFY